jgi:hypothetical protein
MKRTVVGIAIMAVLAGCAPVATPSTAATPTASVSPAPPSASPVPPSASPAPSAAATETPGPTAPAPTVGLVPFNCALPVSLPATVDRAQIVDVRVGTHGTGPLGYDRIAFEFQGPGIPQVTLRSGTPPFTYDPSGLPMPVRGRSFLVLVLHGGTGLTPDGRVTYSGPIDFQPNFPALTEFKQAGDFEAVSEWVAGLAINSSPGVICQRVFILKSPTRLVIDVQHPQG